MPRWVFWMLLTLLSWGIWAILPRQIEQIAPGTSPGEERGVVVHHPK